MGKGLRLQSVEQACFFSISSEQHLLLLCLIAVLLWIRTKSLKNLGIEHTTPVVQKFTKFSTICFSVGNVGNGYV